MCKLVRYLYNDLTWVLECPYLSSCSCALLRRSITSIIFSYVDTLLLCSMVLPRMIISYSFLFEWNYVKPVGSPWKLELKILKNEIDYRRFALFVRGWLLAGMLVCGMLLVQIWWTFFLSQLGWGSQSSEMDVSLVDTSFLLIFPVSFGWRIHHPHQTLKVRYNCKNLGTGVTNTNTKYQILINII